MPPQLGGHDSVLTMNQRFISDGTVLTTDSEHVCARAAAAPAPRLLDPARVVAIDRSMMRLSDSSELAAW